MTKRLRILVLLAVGQLGLLAGPVENTEVTQGNVAAPLGTGLTTYAAFMELAGPFWLRNLPVAMFDSTLHYAGETIPVPALDPLAGDGIVVPEPRSAVLLSIGLAALLLLGIRRRRRTHSHNL